MFVEGTQHRYRSVLHHPGASGKACPEDLVEARPCHSQDCHDFKWRYSTWNGDHRKVWCQRSDGLIAHGK